MVDSAALAPAGRNVRCGRCSHQWHQAPLPPEEEPLILRPLAPEDIAIAPAMANLPAVRATVQPRSAMVGWGLLGVILVVLGSFLWFGRETVIAAWPPAAGAYAVIGIEAPPQLAAIEPPPGAGLELRNINPVRVREDGVSYLVLEGVVVNTTADQRPVPPIVAVLRGEGAQTLQRWTFSAAAAALGPNESVPFSTRFANPSNDTVDIKIDFSADQ